MRWLCFSLVALLLSLFVSTRAIAEDARPNIVFILVDDLGYTDLGCFGSTFYETPSIDGLAASGMRLTSAYAACPVCSPTRASIMTGKYPARIAATDWFGAAGPDRWQRNTKLLPAAYVDRLTADETTLAEALHGAGYATFFAGKWHLGPEGSWPEDHGFQINKGGCEWGAPKGGGGRYFSPYNNPRLENGPDGEYLTQRLANETCQFIEHYTRTSSTQPFLAYLSFYTVHTPLMAPKPLVEKYQAKRESLGEAGLDRWRPERDRKTRIVQNHPTFAAMVESLDNAVGQVLETLERLKLEENTIVVFTSDNGGLSTAEGHSTSNVPLRGGKGWMYEGGIREPTIVRWPGVTTAGSASDAVITSTDYFPTLLEAADLSPLPSQHIDGKSFVSALRGESHTRGPIYWHYPHYSNQGGAPSGAVRDGRWKLIQWYEDGQLELYDLEADISEENNLTESEPEIAAWLQRQLADWREAVGARMPTKNSAYRP